VDGTYGTQLAKERAEIGATRSAELFFEENEVDEDVRYCVFVYLVDGSVREEVLYIRIRVVSILFNSSPLSPTRWEFQFPRVKGMTKRTN
jgi:hypothetical protein